MDTHFSISPMLYAVAPFDIASITNWIRYNDWIIRRQPTTLYEQLSLRFIHIDGDNMMKMKICHIATRCLTDRGAQPDDALMHQQKRGFILTELEYLLTLNISRVIRLSHYLEPIILLLNDI